RIANALAALAKWPPPIVVVDFGTATTFDAISASGAYVGGAILPGVQVSAEALFSRAAKLPNVEFEAPERAVGRTTVESLQSGIMLGYAGAIDALSARIGGELSEAAGGRRCRVVATGGLGKIFFGLCRSIEVYEPNLTLDGLVTAFRRRAGPPDPNRR
ncbi:MAG: type III pantothenate kinase, partial [Fimbriimonadaceae bacterium]